MNDDLNEIWGDLAPAQEKDPISRTLEDHVRAASRSAAEAMGGVAPSGLYEAHFVTSFLRALRGTSLVGLLKFVLEAPGLRSEDITGFVKALPAVMLRDLVSTAVGKTGSGVHLILALELKRRQEGEIYEITKMPSGTLRVSLFPKRLGGQRMEVDLNETFDVLPDPPEEPAPPPATAPPGDPEDESEDSAEADWPYDEAQDWHE